VGRVPALVIAAGADGLMPPQGELLADAINATFLPLEGETHGIIVNPISTQVAETIHEWLSRLQLPNTAC
jgi:pimeloyl-ACP methyl ester carboxylesterase